MQQSGEEIVRRDEWWQRQYEICALKVRYKTHCAAEKSLAHCLKIYGMKLKLYHCECCRGWHLTKGGKGR